MTWVSGEYLCLKSRQSSLCSTWSQNIFRQSLNPGASVIGKHQHRETWLSTGLMTGGAFLLAGRIFKVHPPLDISIFWSD